jgi:uncharacterized NAD-dependent epimerase/dehydratase family protein
METVTPRRYAILTEGLLVGMHGKTAHGVLRYRDDAVAAVIDSQYAGKRVDEVLPALGSRAPVVASLEEAMKFEPNALLVGVATSGGKMPSALRTTVLQAIDAGLEIVNGLHECLKDDPEIVTRAQKSGARLWDVRIPPDDIPLFSGAAYNVSSQVVLAIGSDCAVGKMTAMLEVERAAKEEGASIEFVATGQTGILIAGKGIAVDRVISDFVTGAAEQLVLDAAKNAEVVFVEGQGSIFHPAYAPVTFGLLYGSAPDALVLCHRVGKTTIAGFDNVELPDLAELVRDHEALLDRVKPASVIAIALDTSALSPEEARAAIARTAEETGLPVDDPVRNGGRGLWHAIASGIRSTPKALERAAGAVSR